MLASWERSLGKVRAVVKASDASAALKPIRDTPSHPYLKETSHGEWSSDPQPLKSTICSHIQGKLLEKQEAQSLPEFLHLVLMWAATEGIR